MLEGYSVKDEKAGVFAPPFFTKSVVTAVRSLTDAAMDGKTTLAKYPNDFALYRICAFDEEHGEIHDATPTIICKVSDLVGKDANGKDQPA